MEMAQWHMLRNALTLCQPRRSTCAAGAGVCNSRESDEADPIQRRSPPSTAAPVEIGPEPAFATCS